MITCIYLGQAKSRFSTQYCNIDKPKKKKQGDLLRDMDAEQVFIGWRWDEEDPYFSN